MYLCPLFKIKGLLKLDVLNGAIVTLRYKPNCCFANIAGCLPALAHQTHSGYSLQTTFNDCILLPAILF